ncbi:MAG: GNAT family N-acetyltransferase [Bacteroidia bacterium]
MDFTIPILENDLVSLLPLVDSDFESLYTIASDPLLWEQHPQKNRCEEPIFRLFFNEAIANQMAYKFIDKKSLNVIGTSRFYDCDYNNKSIAIGYTFIARTFWGTKYNSSIKALMIQHAFKFFEKVIFHVDHQNFRSQKAVEKLGAIKIGEKKREFPNETPSINFEYCLSKITI